jgi:hypothetical protein
MSRLTELLNKYPHTLPQKLGISLLNHGTNNFGKFCIVILTPSSCMEVYHNRIDNLKVNSGNGISKGNLHQHLMATTVLGFVHRKFIEFSMITNPMVPPEKTL